MPVERPDPPPERLYAVNAAAAQFYASRLPVSRKAARYLARHGINTAADPTGPWQVGYAPGRWTELATHLRAAGFTDEAGDAPDSVSSTTGADTYWTASATGSCSPLPTCTTASSDSPPATWADAPRPSG
ncbi:hypothetical protein [Salinispora arenicola]|uniref:hypothetical protein n=1 Tax=Salinispora arenicola TaxID=168697 RepID=UPI0027DD518B|nr:hypothetical protein [Salinispora arenicola]